MRGAEEVDYLFRGATVIDGSGGPPCVTDVAVHGGIISGVSRDMDPAGAVVMEAAGLVLAPGFIDIHGHSDLSLFRHPGAESKLSQGVTLEVVGNCGLSAFPVNRSRQPLLAEYLAMHEFSLPPDEWPWTDFESYADCLDRLGLGINMAPLVGHSTLRIAAMGMDDRNPSLTELNLMEQVLAKALEQGAWGMSTGLIYPPGSFAGRDELTALSRVVAAQGGLCTSHIRGEGDTLFQSVDEAIALARESGARMQVSHLKALGKANRGKGAEALRRLAAARESGVDIAADQYPYAASSTSLTAVLPHWCHEGGVARMLERLGNPELRCRLESEIGAAMAKREGASGIMVASCTSPANRELAGKTLAEIGVRWACSPASAVVRLLVEERGEVPAIFFSMAEEDVETILRSPDVAVGSDGHGLDAAHAEGGTHPRSYGCFPRVLGRYVREKVLELPLAVHKMTGLPATRLELTDRGFIRPGYVADMVLFDPEVISDRADYVNPHRYSTGIVHVLLNGMPVIRDGAFTGERRGRVLRRTRGKRGNRR